jgi:hypothetical protein
MLTDAYLTTPKPSSVQWVDMMASCPPPPRRAADDTSMLVMSMGPAVPGLDFGSDEFFLAAPSSSSLDEGNDDDEQFFTPFRIPITLKPRPSSNTMKPIMAVPICTLKPRPAKQLVDDDNMKMGPSIQNSYQLSIKKQKRMHRSPSFSSPAA